MLCVVAAFLLLGGGAGSFGLANSVECHGGQCQGAHTPFIMIMTLAVGFLVLSAFAALASVCVLVLYARSLREAAAV